MNEECPFVKDEQLLNGQCVKRSFRYGLRLCFLFLKKSLVKLIERKQKKQFFFILFLNSLTRNLLG